MNNIEKITNDILKLEKALTLIEKTETYWLFNKSKLIADMCEEISNLKDKRDILRKRIQELSN
jgi:uncharacterized coiled-coil DUF342 family protein